MKEVKTGKGFLRNLVRLLKSGVKNEFLVAESSKIETHKSDQYSITIKIDYIKADAKDIEELVGLFRNWEIGCSESYLASMRELERFQYSKV